MKYPATSKRAEWLGVGIYKVRNGRITEGWFAEDLQPHTEVVQNALDALWHGLAELPN